MSGPLTPDEVRELDSYGGLCGAMLLGLAVAPRRAIELWEREILHGRSEFSGRNGLLADHNMLGDGHLRTPASQASVFGGAAARGVDESPAPTCQQAAQRRLSARETEVSGQGLRCASRSKDE